MRLIVGHGANRLSGESDNDVESLNNNEFFGCLFNQSEPKKRWCAKRIEGFLLAVPAKKIDDNNLCWCSAEETVGLVLAHERFSWKAFKHGQRHFETQTFWSQRWTFWDACFLERQLNIVHQCVTLRIFVITTATIAISSVCRGATWKLSNESRKKSVNTGAKIQNQHFRYQIHTGN